MIVLSPTNHEIFLHFIPLPSGRGKGGGVKIIFKVELVY
jgi:hypothetical protein